MVPPDAVRFAVYDARSNVFPVVMLRFPLIDMLFCRVAEPVLLMVRLLKVVVVVPPMVWLVPLKVTVEVPGVKVPLLVKFPLTVSVLVPVMDNVAPLFMVRFRQTAAAPMTG